ncbi:hypothetical protein, partial [Parabacteroides johnsonii]|uniref:hypothetical protein n=2 Tax=Parabacteroides johnsonii TaxID=387661 RepID=UPI00266CBFA4
RLKLASLKQQTLRTLTPVSALNAHQLRPEIEPDGSLRMADTACFFAIPHQVRERGCSCPYILSPCLTQGLRRTVGIDHPKRKRSFL